MPAEQIALPADAASALSQVREESRKQPVVIFKRSPTCPISLAAEAEFERWLAGIDPKKALSWCVIDVLAKRELARGLTALLGIAHQSPQALCFREGELSWHGSHQTLTQACFRAVCP